MWDNNSPGGRETDWGEGAFKKSCLFSCGVLYKCHLHPLLMNNRGWIQSYTLQAVTVRSVRTYLGFKPACWDWGEEKTQVLYCYRCLLPGGLNRSADFPLIVLSNWLATWWTSKHLAPDDYAPSRTTAPTPTHRLAASDAATKEFPPH